MGPDATCPPRLVFQSSVPVRALFGVGLALVGIGLLLMSAVNGTSAWTVLLAPFRSRSWVGALRDTAKSLGTIQESRAQYLRARRQLS